MVLSCAMHHCTMLHGPVDCTLYCTMRWLEVAPCLIPRSDYGCKRSTQSAASERTIRGASMHRGHGADDAPKAMMAGPPRPGLTSDCVRGPLPDPTRCRLRSPARALDRARRTPRTGHAAQPLTRAHDKVGARVRLRIPILHSRVGAPLPRRADPTGRRRLLHEHRT